MIDNGAQQSSWTPPPTSPIRRNSFGTAALVLGILGILTAWVPGIGIVLGGLGLIFGIVAWRRYRRGGFERGATVPGLAVSAFAVSASIISMIMWATVLSDTGDKVAEKAPTATDSVVTPTPSVEPPTSDPGDITDHSSDEPTSFNLGETATITTDGTDSGTINVSKLEITTQPTDQYGSGPAEKYFLIFTVKLRASAPNFDTYDMDFYVATKGGQRVDQGEGNSYDAADYGKTIGYAELNTGEHKTGLLVFDSPSKHGTLNYAPNFEGGPIATWIF